MPSALTLNGMRIRYQADPYVFVNATDLWKANGRPLPLRPAQWLRHARARRTIETLAAALYPELDFEEAKERIHQAKTGSSTWINPLLSLGYAWSLGKEKAATAVARLYVQEGLLRPEQLPAKISNFLQQPANQPAPLWIVGQKTIPLASPADLKESLQRILYRHGVAYEAPNPALAFDTLLESSRRLIQEAGPMSPARQLALGMLEQLLHETFESSQVFGYAACVELAHSRAKRLAEALN